MQMKLSQERKRVSREARKAKRNSEAHFEIVPTAPPMKPKEIALYSCLRYAKLTEIIHWVNELFGDKKGRKRLNRDHFIGFMVDAAEENFEDRFLEERARDAF